MPKRSGSRVGPDVGPRALRHRRPASRDDPRLRPRNFLDLFPGSRDRSSLKVVLRSKVVEREEQRRDELRHRLEEMRGSRDLRQEAPEDAPRVPAYRGLVGVEERLHGSAKILQHRLRGGIQRKRDRRYRAITKQLFHVRRRRSLSIPVLLRRNEDDAGRGARRQTFRAWMTRRPSSVSHGATFSRTAVSRAISSL